MKFGSLIYAGMIFVPALAYAQSSPTWFMLSARDAQCEQLPQGALTDPQDAVDYFRHQNMTPNVSISRNPNGSVASVTISVIQAGGNESDLAFFTTMGGCQTKLKNLIASGVITDPNDLK
jgi:hypothetical protein